MFYWQFRGIAYVLLHFIREHKQGQQNKRIHIIRINMRLIADKSDSLDKRHVVRTRLHDTIAWKTQLLILQILLQKLYYVEVHNRFFRLRFGTSIGRRISTKKLGSSLRETYKMAGHGIPAIVAISKLGFAELIMVMKFHCLILTCALIATLLISGSW